MQGAATAAERLFEILATRRGWDEEDKGSNCRRSRAYPLRMSFYYEREIVLQNINGD